MKKACVDRVKVVYIAGWSRSGSTILSNVLGEIDGFFHAGELRDIWDRGFRGLCGCGLQLGRCRIWGPVIQRAFGGREQIDVAKMIALRDRYARSHYVPFFEFLPSRRVSFRAHAEEYLRKLECMYREIRNVTGCRIIVDSSKNLGYAYALAMVPTVEVYVVHLVRDARATAYSWRRRKKGLWQMHPAVCSLGWNMRNGIAEILRRKWGPGRFRKIYYEDFVREPESTVSDLVAFLKEPPAPLPFVSHDSVRLGVNHTVYANPNRLQTGVRKVKADDAWKMEMRSLDRLTVLALTWPLLLRYGYIRWSGRKTQVREKMERSKDLVTPTCGRPGGRA